MSNVMDISQTTALPCVPNIQVLHPARCLAYSINLLILMLGTAACSFQRSTPVELSFQVVPASRPGVYQLSGVTNLPEGSQLAVMAVRYLQPSTDATPIRVSQSNYAILARDQVEVSQGQWKSNLMLWQVSGKGHYQESWQHYPNKLTLSPKASNQVMFVAIFEPDNQSRSVSEQLKHQELKSPLLRFTPTGQQYLQASYALPLSLPSGTSESASGATDDSQDTWADRSVMKPDSFSGPVVSTPPKGKQLNTPLPLANFLR